MKEKKRILLNFTCMHKKVHRNIRQDKHNKTDTLTNQCFKAYLPYMAIDITIPMALW